MHDFVLDWLASIDRRLVNINRNRKGLVQIHYFFLQIFFFFPAEVKARILLALLEYTGTFNESIAVFFKPNNIFLHMSR